MSNFLNYTDSTIITVLDFETENLLLNLKYNHPWEVAAIKAQGNTILEEYRAYLKYDDRPLKVGAKAAEITHFNQEKYNKEAIPVKEGMTKVIQMIQESDYCVAQNILNFDLHFLYEFYRLYSFSTTGLVDKIIDTHPIAKGLKLNKPYDSTECSFIEYQYQMTNIIAKGVKTNNKALADDYKIPYNAEILHQALEDIRLTWQIWNKMKYYLGL